MCKQFRLDSAGLCDFSYVKYSRKCVTQICRTLFGNATLVSLWGAWVRPQTGREISSGFCLNTKRVLIQRHDLGPVSIVIEYCFAAKHLFFIYISFAKLIFSWSNRATYRRAGRSLFDSSEFETDNFLERTWNDLFSGQVTVKPQDLLHVLTNVSVETRCLY